MIENCAGERGLDKKIVTVIIAALGRSPQNQNHPGMEPKQEWARRLHSPMRVPQSSSHCALLVSREPINKSSDNNNTFSLRQTRLVALSMIDVNCGGVAIIKC
jgi:hypothetical protein